MSNIIIQAIVAFAMFAFAVLGFNFYSPDENWGAKIFKEPKTHKTLGIIFSILAVLCLAYFICDSFFFHRVSWFWAIAKLIILVIGIIAFIYIEYQYLGDLDYIPGLATLIAYIIIIILCASVLGFGESLTIDYRQEKEYESKIVAVEEPKVSTSNFNLISINDITDIESSYNVTLSNDLTFYVIVETKQEKSEEGQKDYEVYSVYYKPNGNSNKFEPLTINKDATELYFIEEDEVPHIKVITSTYYDLDTNVEPNKECNHKKELSYELHIPKSSMLNAVKKDVKQNN